MAANNLRKAYNTKEIKTGSAGLPKFEWDPPLSHVLPISPGIHLNTLKACPYPIQPVRGKEVGIWMKLHQAELVLPPEWTSLFPIGDQLERWLSQ